MPVTKQSKNALRELDSQLREMRLLSMRLIERQEKERLWAARELHDVLGQSFTLLKLILDAAKHTDLSELPGIIDDALSVVDEATEKVRRVSRGMRPGLLDLSLEQSLKWLFAASIKEQGLDITFYNRGLKGNLPQELNTAVYRIVQEALDNVLCHAGVKTASVSLSVKGRNLVLEIADEGIGFDIKKVTGGRCGGLIFMRERAAMVDGDLRIKSKPGDGTTVSAAFPLPKGELAPQKPLC